MFYQGSLQEGISSAVGQQKMVVCFVTNGNEESREWEDDFLQDSSLMELLRAQAVALRLEAGSDAAGYLAQIFPLPQTPTVVVMKHGELKEYIAPGTVKDDFIRRLQSAFNAPPRQAGEPPAAAASSSPAAPPSPEAGRSESVSRVLAERAARLKASKDEGERRAQEERAEAKGKGKADADAGRDTDAARNHRQAELLRRRKQQQSDERQRILKRIEDDHAERRQRAAERDLRRRRAADDSSSSSQPAGAASSMPSTTRAGDMASLQVRLFDGATLRSRFRTDAPFAEVRAWVDARRTDGAAPYTFRQLLTPAANRAIDEAGEGHRTLGELGLAPSSTLVLVPVRSYASAYEAAGPQSWWAAAAAAVWAWCVWLVGLVGLGLGGGARAPAASAPESEAGRGDGRRTRGLDGPAGARRDHQLYNGNSLNFEPRPDDDDA